MVQYPTSKDKAEESPELALDRPEELSFCKAIEALGPTPTGTVRLFDRGDFYSSHGTDAHYIAKEVYRTTSVLKYLGARSGKDGPTEGLASCTMNRNVAQQFLRDALTGKALRIEMYSNGGKKGAAWQISKIASPGNLSEVEDLLFANSDIMEAPVLMAIKLSVKESTSTCGIAFVDTSIRNLGVSEFVDNELFSNTEALLIQLGVKEVLLPADDKSTGYEAEKLRQVIDRCNIVITDRKKGDFQAKNIEQDLNRLLKDDLQAATLPEFDLKHAMSAAAAVISYLNLLGDSSNHGAYGLQHHDLSQFMRLDASTLRALHLMPDAVGTGGSGSKNMSLFGLLNCCKTSQGSRLLGQWLKQPLINLHEIERRQDLVEGLLDDHDLRVALQDGLKKMPDLHRLSKRFKKGVASLENVVRAYQAILELPTFIDALNNAAGDNEALHTLFVETYVKPMHDSHEALKPYSDLVETTVDLDELDNHNYVIKPEYDENLGAIRDRLKGVTKSLDDEHARVAADLGFETDNKNLHFEQNPIYGHCFRLTRKEAAVLRGKKGFIELANRNNGTFFTTSAMRNLSTDFKDLTQKYERKQSSLVKEVINIAASYAEVFEPLNNNLAHLDVIVSFAHVAHSMDKPYVKPTVHAKGEGSMKLVEARHACLEVQEEMSFIPNDCEMIRGEHELTVLSGPNMCGKSTYIRQIGCIALLAQIGSFVPCTSAELPVFDMILCRVGAGDSQLKGVSTFMAEMLETATILKSATKDSLVIIDELGRGTSTYDGFGLAWAISEHIATEIRCFCLFATHFHELAGLANQIGTVKNMHVVAEVLDKPGSVTGKEVVLLYKVAPGACDKSFGIHVAELAHFPEEVIKHAKRKADELEDFGNEVATTPEIPAEVVTEGVELVRKFCQEWSVRDSVTMDVDSDLPALNAERFKRLRACFEDARPQLEANAWFQHVIASL